MKILLKLLVEYDKIRSWPTDIRNWKALASNDKGDTDMVCQADWHYNKQGLGSISILNRNIVANFLDGNGMMESNYDEQKLSLDLGDYLDRQ